MTFAMTCRDTLETLAFFFFLSGNSKCHCAFQVSTTVFTFDIRSSQWLQQSGSFLPNFFKRITFLPDLSHRHNQNSAPGLPQQSLSMFELAKQQMFRRAEISLKQKPFCFAYNFLLSHSFSSLTSQLAC